MSSGGHRKRRNRLCSFSLRFLVCGERIWISRKANPAHRLLKAATHKFAASRSVSRRRIHGTRIPAYAFFGVSVKPSASESCISRNGGRSGVQPASPSGWPGLRHHAEPLKRLTGGKASANRLHESTDTVLVGKTRVVSIFSAPGFRRWQRRPCRSWPSSPSLSPWK